MKTLKTFEDFKFAVRYDGKSINGQLELGNNFIVSVSTRLEREGIGGLYGFLGDGTYEVAVIDSRKKGSCNQIPLGTCVDTVLCYQSVDQINKLIEEVSLGGDAWAEQQEFRYVKAWRM